MCDRCKQLEAELAALKAQWQTLLKPHEYGLDARIREMGDYHAALNAAEDTKWNGWKS